MQSQRFCAHAFKRRQAVRALLASAAAALAFTAASASSHSDAPLIKQDPQCNLTDVYGFISAGYGQPDQKSLSVIVNVRPLIDPGDGAMFDRFADDARYSIHITDPATGETKLRYDFFFSAVDGGLKNPGTLLAYGLGTEAGGIEDVGDARQNFTQTYRVEKVVGESTVVIADGLLTPPPNGGSRLTPHYNHPDGRAKSGANTEAELDRYTQQTVFPVESGEVLFCGPRDDAFYADVAGIFDLLNPRIIDNNGTLNDGLGQDGHGVDFFRGYNVLTYAVQIPVADLVSAGIPTGFNSVFFGEQTGVGIYATVSRPRTRTINEDGTREYSGGWVQVNRLGNPLFNEGFVAHQDKDRYNRTAPTIDVENYSKYAENPELAFLINFVLFGDPTGQSPIQTGGRADLVGVFMPDVLRVVTTTGPVPLDGDWRFSRFGFIGGDTTDGVSSGWPNGRRMGDDVVDIALTALVSGPTYSQIVVTGDNVTTNDLPFNQVFPYAATPHSGANSSQDSACFAPPASPADMDCDGSVNFNDIDPFVMSLIGRDSYETRYPDCNYLNGDIDNDGIVTWDDIDGFVECLINGGC